MLWTETAWPTQEHVCSETHVEWETCSCRGHGGKGWQVACHASRSHGYTGAGGVVVQQRGES